MNLKRRFPTSADLRKEAQRRLPNFAFEYADGGAGGDDQNIRRNWAALDGVELVPRAGRITLPPPADTVLFDRPYAAPLGMAPMGSPSVAFPGADLAMALAAQNARLPFVLGSLAGLSVERAGQIAPDVLWFQLYRFHRDDHRIGMDLLRRAEAAGVHVMMLTMDTPIRTVRPREVRSGIVSPFRLSMKLRFDALSAPRWLYAMARHGVPRFASLAPYMGDNLGIEAMARFSSEEIGGAFTWDDVALYRDKWKKPLVLKGILHPADVEKAIALGLDGVVVSNHGGRQIEALPTAIDMLPALVEVAKNRLTLLMDSGVRSGTDVARAVALGADAALAGKAFLWSLGALGLRGPGHLTELFVEEIGAALGQLGCANVEELRSVATRHPTAYRVGDFSVPPVGTSGAKRH